MADDARRPTFWVLALLPSNLYALAVFEGGWICDDDGFAADEALGNFDVAQRAGGEEGEVGRHFAAEGFVVNRKENV